MEVPKENLEVLLLKFKNQNFDFKENKRKKREKEWKKNIIPNNLIPK